MTPVQTTRRIENEKSEDKIDANVMEKHTPPSLPRKIYIHARTSDISNLSNLDLTKTDDTQDTASASNSATVSDRKEIKGGSQELCHSIYYHQFEYGCSSPQASTFNALNSIHPMNDNLSFSTINTNEERSSDISNFWDCIDEDVLTKQKNQNTDSCRNGHQYCMETIKSQSASIIHNQAQNIITEQSIFAHAIFSLLMDRKKLIEKKKMISLKNESKTILKSGRIMKVKNILKGQWEPKYVEITRGSLMYEDDDDGDNIGIMRRLFSFSPSHSLSSIVTTIDFLSDANESTSSPIKPVQTPNRRKTLPLRKNKCTCRAVKLRNEQSAHYASPSPSRLLSNNAKKSFLFELTIESGPKRLWMVNSREDRTAWIQAIHKAMINKESHDKNCTGTNKLSLNYDDLSSDEKVFNLFIPPLHIRSLYQNDMISCINLQREIMKAGGSNKDLKSALEFFTEKRSVCVPMTWVNEMLSANESNEKHKIKTQNDCNFTKRKISTEMHSIFNINGLHFNINEGNRFEKILGTLSNLILNPECYSMESNRINMAGIELTRKKYKMHAIDECDAVAFAFNTLVSSGIYDTNDKLHHFIGILFPNTYNLLSIESQSFHSEKIEINVSHGNYNKQEGIRSKKSKYLQGWISISNKITKKWRKLFCMLDNNGVLRYYEKSKPHPHGLRGEMFLQHATMATSESGKGTYIIVIISSDKSKKLKLWFKSSNKFSLWVKTIEQAMNHSIQNKFIDTFGNHDHESNTERKVDDQKLCSASDSKILDSQSLSVADKISTNSFCSGWIKMRKDENNNFVSFFCSLSEAGRFSYSEREKSSCEEIQLQHRIWTLKQGGTEGNVIVISSFDQVTQLQLYFDQEDEFSKWKYSFQRILENKKNLKHYEASKTSNCNDKAKNDGTKAVSICKGLLSKRATPVVFKSMLRTLHIIDGNVGIDQSPCITREDSASTQNIAKQIPSSNNHQFKAKQKLSHSTSNSSVKITTEVPTTYKISLRGPGDDISDSSFVLNMKITIKKSFHCYMKQMKQEQDIIEIVFEQIIKNDQKDKMHPNLDYDPYDPIQTSRESTNESMAELRLNLLSHTLYTSNIDEIQLYIHLFNSPVLCHRLNEAMNQQINTVQSAEMLQQYYILRPKLKNFTFEKSLSSFKYTIHSENKDLVLTDAISIEKKYNQSLKRKTIEEDILWRAANISLIDCIIPAFTNLKSPLYRKDLQITAIVKKCHFILFLNLSEKIRLKCLCDIAFRMPNITPEIGTIQLQINFIPSTSISSPKLWCQVTSVNPLPISNDEILEMTKNLTDNILNNDEDHDNDVLFSFHPFVLTEVAGKHDDTLYSFSFLPSVKVFDEIDRVSLAHYLQLLIFSFKHLLPFENSIKSVVCFLHFVFYWWSKQNLSKSKCGFV